VTLGLIKTKRTTNDDQQKDGYAVTEIQVSYSIYTFDSDRRRNCYWNLPKLCSLPAFT
jgi:hypothetical protein